MGKIGHDEILPPPLQSDYIPPLPDKLIDQMNAHDSEYPVERTPDLLIHPQPEPSQVVSLIVCFLFLAYQ
jgi:hypothetical protein